MYLGLLEIRGNGQLLFNSRQEYFHTYITSVTIHTYSINKKFGRPYEKGKHTYVNENKIRHRMEINFTNKFKLF
jgi:hypothetical protein